jgi:hypothetical protein
MKLIHYAPISVIRRIGNHGIACSRKTGRLHGVYAVPLLDFPRTATANWYRQLRSSTGRKNGSKHLGSVIFEIDDAELVYFFRDWVHNALGERTLVTARQAEALTFELGRQRATPLTPFQIETLLTYCGEISYYDQPSYNLDLMEVVVPRAIRPEEIVAVIEPDYRRRKRELQAARDQRLDLLD